MKSKSRAEKMHMAAVADLTCIICGRIGVHVHHIKEERIKNHFLTIPLCPDHHVGEYSIHMCKEQFENVEGSELELLAKTIEKLTIKGNL